MNLRLLAYLFGVCVLHANAMEKEINKKSEEVPLYVIYGQKQAAQDKRAHDALELAVKQNTRLDIELYPCISAYMKMTILAHNEKLKQGASDKKLKMIISLKEKRDKSI